MVKWFLTNSAQNKNPPLANNKQNKSSIVDVDH